MTIPVQRAMAAEARARAKIIMAKAFGRDARGNDLDTPCVEIQDDATVSRGTAPGVWVQAWVWVPQKVHGEENNAGQPG